MNKIAVIGRPGSGKSVFSRALAKRSGLPLYHLDRIYHELAKQYSGEELSQVMRLKIEQIINADTWLSDGNYGSSLDVRLPKADTIFYFDYPLYVVVYQLIKRRIIYARRPREDMPEGWKERFNVHFYRSHVFGYKKSSSYNRMLDLLKQAHSDGRLIVFTSPKDADLYLENLDQNGQTKGERST